MRTLRILVLRPADHAGALATRLRAIGIEPVVVPAVAINPPAAWDGVDDALDRLASCHWLLFTSASGVETFFARRRARGIPGAVTAEAVRGMGWQVDVVAPRYSVDGIIQVIDERRASLAAGYTTS